MSEESQLATVVSETIDLDNEDEITENTAAQHVVGEITAAAANGASSVTPQPAAFVADNVQTNSTVTTETDVPVEANAFVPTAIDNPRAESNEIAPKPLEAAEEINNSIVSDIQVDVSINTDGADSIILLESSSDDRELLDTTAEKSVLNVTEVDAGKVEICSGDVPKQNENSTLMPETSGLNKAEVEEIESLLDKLEDLEKHSAVTEAVSTTSADANTDAEKTALQKTTDNETHKEAMEIAAPINDDMPNAKTGANDVENVKANEVIMLSDSSDDEEPKHADNVAVTEKAPEQPALDALRTSEQSNAQEMEQAAESNTTESIAMDVEDPAEVKTAQVEGDTASAMDVEESLLDVKPNKSPSPVPAAEQMAIDETVSAEIFYNKECISYDCPKKHKQFIRATSLTLSFYKISSKRNKPQYVCIECYDKALDMFEECGAMLYAKQPILFKDVGDRRPEFVEIIDSSDDEVDAESDNKSAGEFSSNDLNLINEELENTIQAVLGNVDIQNQLTWSLTMLETRLKHSVEESMLIDNELRELQKKTTTMFDSLYQCQKVKIAELPPIDLNTGQTYAPSDNQLKPIGEVVRPPIEINECYYAVKNKPLASWVPCKVTEQVDVTTGAYRGLQHFKVRFLGSQYPVVKTVPIKHMAYFEPPEVRLPIGTRVIAYFDASTLATGKEKGLVQSAFYPGIIAEPLKGTNKYRYLIFYDDGYTQYVNHRDVRLVCHASDKVWEDVHAGSRDFIEKYVTQYNINRPMVQTHKGQSMSTESNGVWLYARVVDIDCSLVKMQFDGPKAHTEWIYRGSLRLGPVFREYHKMQKMDIPQSRLPRRTEPFIRYTDDEEASSNQTQRTTTTAPALSTTETQQRAVARKSVSRQETQPQPALPAPPTPAAVSGLPTVKHLNNSTIYVEDETVPKGKVVYYTAKRNLPPRQYHKHFCSKSCLFTIQHNLSTYSPLSKPLLSGWERLIMRQKVKKVCVYRAPCGKMLRNMQEIRDYLRATDNVLNVDNFDFTPETCCLAEYVIESSIIYKRDIANGLEKMALPLVNYYDNTLPPECVYAAQRIPTEGVYLNLDEEFLVGCDCEDDCLDKSKCSCWQLTLAGAKYGNPNTPQEDVGYQFKRLYEHVPTGIYECNSRCKCKANCLNRVVQQSLQMKLQVFKTNNRGWGLRCINDIPRGSFICIYAGYLLTESKANEGGVDAGDEYFAELDYIEVAEQVKEGYESDVEPPEPEDEDEDRYRGEDDADFRPGKSFLQRTKSRDKPTRQRDSQSGDNDSQERQVINFNPNADLDETTQRESSIRRLFGKDEACYVMDAKTIGNLGRYFNHSCSPNLFVQNVFVDTHDLRFPWVAFFASTHIRAGTELTWNYNYEVGVVPGKVLYCQCGAPNCRQRLL